MQPKYINININIRENNLYLEKDENPAMVSIDTGEDDSIPNNIRIELGITKVFHKVLNLIKSEPDLFQKEDFELLGEMLAKILFGKKNDTKNFRNYIMKDVEFLLDQKNQGGNKICRIYLEFDYDSKVAMLPWEYTRYQTRATDVNAPQSWYIAANNKSRFNLIRRVKRNPTPQPDAEMMFVIVIANMEGNNAADPSIDVRIKEFPKIKSLFQNLQQLNSNEPENFPYPLEVAYLENISSGDIGKEIERIYHQWETTYQVQPNYIIHYTGHAMMRNQVGQIVVKNKEDKMEWREDKKFAAIFNKEKLTVPQPSLVCLQACDSAKIGSIGGELRGVAYEFTRLDIPAVVGMQNEINTSSSCAFFEKFYASLLKGDDVASAITNGRDHLGINFNIDDETYINNSFGSPVLFITTREPIQLLKSTAAEILNNQTGNMADANRQKTRLSESVRDINKNEKSLLQENANQQNTDTQADQLLKDDLSNRNK